jgi:hypothetical protein
MQLILHFNISVQIFINKSSNFEFSPGNTSFIHSSWISLILLVEVALADFGLATFCLLQKTGEVRYDIYAL